MKSFAVCSFACLAVLSATHLHAESLNYVISWPSGLSLGEATLTSDHKSDPKQTDPKQPDAKSSDAKPSDSKPNDSKQTDPKQTEPKASDPKPEAATPKTPGPWSFQLDLEASVPGFNIRDHYQSSADAGLCSAELKKSVSHGGHKSEEKVVFDPHKNTATRESGTSGKTEIDVPACAHDGLAFLQFARLELAQGRMAPQQAVIFGGAYQVRLVFVGTQPVNLDGKKMDADHLQATIKGPSREYTIELYFSRDAARTPVMARLALPLGAFTVELMGH
jgi:hypothetical protein